MMTTKRTDELIEDWQERLDDAFVMADGLLWHRIQRGRWVASVDSQKVNAMHKAIEKCRKLLLEVSSQEAPVSRDTKPATP